MVAKSFQGLEIIGDPYTISGRQYIKVRTKSGSERQVRYYTEYEYYKMYPEEAIHRKMKTQKEILGFEKGYITIFKGNTYEDKEYFQMNSARYTRLWGWYFISTEELPDDIPDDVEPVRLPWDAVGNADGTLKSDEEVSAAVDSLVCDPDISEYQGEVGDKLELIVTIENVIALNGNYGPSTLYFMKDENKNIYIWITTSVKTRLEKGCSYKIKGTVKEHKQYRAQKQTILTRCVVIK